MYYTVRNLGMDTDTTKILSRSVFFTGSSCFRQDAEHHWGQARIRYRPWADYPRPLIILPEAMLILVMYKRLEEERYAA
ncbi:MAG: hypothetical protein ACXWTH_13465 [Methylosarcina sp.]